MSGKRQLIFAPGEFYHLFNRTNGREQIFNSNNEIKRALALISYYKYKSKLRFSYYNNLNPGTKDELNKKNITQTPIVEIFTYALMPNHFHFLLKENSENGIQTFISNFQNSFAKYINTKNKRDGSLFQSPFKAVHIDGEKEFIHVSRYIHLNPVSSFLMDFNGLKESKLTSFSIYIKNESSFINSEFVINIFGSIQKYEEFVKNQVDYQRNLNKIKHLIFD